MADRDTTFKITDRRKFNADGSPRDAEETAEPDRETAVDVETTKEPLVEPSGNVVSFPSETANRAAASSSETSASTPPPPEHAASGRTAAGQAESAYNQASASRPSGLPEASFLGLVNMLGVEAAMHLGLMETPGDEPQPPDLEAARHLIDTLGMLQAKTRGNLTPDEDTLLDSILADLRMQFVAASRSR